MLRRSVTVAVTLALLFCGVTVSLEAVGLLFHAGAPDPQQRIEAFVSRLEADLSPVDLPTEPVEVLREAAREPPDNDPEPVPVAQPVHDGDGASRVAEIPDRAEPEGGSDDPLVVAFSSTVPNPQNGIAALPDEFVAPAESPSESHESAPAVTAVQASSRAPPAARPAQRMAGAPRPRPTQGATGYAAFGWPMLDWLIW
jgi:hypothetical protein